jgi:hypothetical protein
MVRACSGGILGTMTRVALCWDSFESTVLMAGCACNALVRTDHRECREVMVEPLSPGERSYTMALCTLGGESCRCMVWVPGRLEVSPVAADACRGCAGVLMGGSVRVTRLAIQRHVSPHQRETSLLVTLGHVVDEPRLRRVTTCAVLAKLALVNVGVA